MIQSFHILEDRSHWITSGQISQDDTIPLHSRGSKSPNHFRTSVQEWYNPTATSLLPLSRKVFLNNTNLVSKAFELYWRQRLHQHISVESSSCNIIIWTIIIYIFSMWILNYHHLYLQYVNTELSSSVSPVSKYWTIIIYIFSIEILKASSSLSLV